MNVYLMVRRVLLAGMAIFAGLAAMTASIAVAQDASPSVGSSTWRGQTTGPKPDWSWLTVMRFMTDTDYPPFNYRDEGGALTGFNVDLARAICKELEVTCKITPTAWSKHIPSLKKDKADAIIASLAITPQTIEQVDFTNSYYTTPAKFVTLKSSSITEVTPEELYGSKIAVLKGSAHEAYLRHFFPTSEIMAMPTAAEAKKALKDGKADLLFGDAISLMFWINGADSEKCCQFRGHGFLDAKYFGEGVGIAVTKGNIRLLEVLNYALARLRASGRFEELQLRYFPLPIY
ncbi:MAG: transporter substrate-binding domain-containing protein [Alphaproteobacteria bacterium]